MTYEQDVEDLNRYGGKRGMIMRLVTDYGVMTVPGDVFVPDQRLMPLSFAKWLAHQTERAKHAFTVGRSLPLANDGGW